MAKLRHIALIVTDPEASAKFYEQAFDLKVVGRARRGIYLSDGTVNLALLKVEGNEKPGVYHFGAWVDDLDPGMRRFGFNPFTRAVGDEVHADLLRLIAEGSIRPHVGRLVSMDEAGAALDDHEQRRSVGRTVVHVADG